MIYPDFIKCGDTIGVTATSSGNGDELHIRKVEFAKKAFEERKFKIYETPNVRTDKKCRSSSKEARAKEFMELIENKDIDAIITARGGEFLLEILPYIDFDRIKENPKWVQGYSDTTGLGFCITTISDVATIYGENFGSFAMTPWHEALNKNLDLLEGKCLVQKSFEKYQNSWQDEEIGNEPWLATENVEWKNANNEDRVNISGRLIGGCIDILGAIIGTKFDHVVDFCSKYKNDGFIWFFDNCELSSEDIFRTLWQMKQAEWFKRTKGIIFGRPMTRRSNCDISFEQSVIDAIGDLNVPIIFDADIGHVPPQITLINGAVANVISERGKGEIKFLLK